MTRKLIPMMAVLLMVAIPAAFSAPSPHTMAVIDGTMHKSEDGKSYVLRVESAKTENGEEIPDMKGKEMAMPGDMSEDMKMACEKCCDKAVQMKCCVEDGKIVAVSSLTKRDLTKPGTKKP